MPAPGGERAHSQILRKHESPTILGFGFIEETGLRGDVGQDPEGASQTASAPALSRLAECAPRQIAGLVKPARHHIGLSQRDEEQR